MIKMLIIGDTHIPDRADAIYRSILESIESEKPYDIVVFTGDFTGEEILKWVKGLGKEVYYVRGNMDYLPLPKTQVFTVDGLVFGVHHGDGVYPRGNIRQLTRIAKELGCIVLFSGHTHSPFIKVDDSSGILHVNPGSLTGVWGGGGGLMKPSFIKAYYSSKTLLLRLFVLERGELVETKSMFRWNGSRWIQV